MNHPIFRTWKEDSSMRMLMRDYLQEHLGVQSPQIMNLCNSEATRAAIIEGIDAFNFVVKWLNDGIKEGDPI